MPARTKKDTTTKTAKKSTEKVSQKAPKAPKEEKETSKVVVQEPPKEVQTNVVVSETQEATVSTAADDFAVVLSAVQELTSKLSALKFQIRALEKKHTREMKIATKSKRRAASKAPRTPSGFVKPTKISAELAAFLGKADGTEMARTEVTKEINAYIRSNGLQNKENGRIINADSKLKSLLKLKSDDELTYFNLQRYMSPHFTKATTA